ncbi:MAG: DNA-deoxyinosine glycosylase [Candidatus Metalachnospira sp.]|nr:DNA-deoxyinosine glycosylase [Candidatus Metalachnospira sp.]
MIIIIKEINKLDKEVNYQHLVHTFEPVYDKNSKILILGSFPSVKSREANFFYGHPKNRFWNVISSVFECVTPDTIEDKKNFLYNNNIALWDTIHSCDIIGSSDSSIKNVVPSDISLILNSADINAVFANGAASHKLYMKYCYPLTNTDAIKLPSTSPANAAFSLEKLILIWSIEIKKSFVKTNGL